MLLFLCKLFESQKLGFYKTRGWEKKSGFFRARVRVSMCAPTHIRTHGHTAMPTHSILNWLNTPRLAQGLRQSNFGLSSPHQWRINDFYKNSPSKILLFHAKSLILQCSIIKWQSRKLFHKKLLREGFIYARNFWEKDMLLAYRPLHTL